MKLKTLAVALLLTGATSAFATDKAAGSPTTALAASGAATNATAAKDSSKPATSADVMTEGEVRKVDKDAKKITIKHGEIANLGMPPMTMVFQVKDSKTLTGLKQGDKIRFHVEQEAGNMVVTKVEVSK